MLSLEHILKYLDASAEQDLTEAAGAWLGEILVSNHLLCCGLKCEERIRSSPAECSADAMNIFK